MLLVKAIIPISKDMGGFVKYNIKIYWRKILKMLFDDRFSHNKKVEIKVVISIINIKDAIWW